MPVTMVVTSTNTRTTPMSTGMHCYETPPDSQSSLPNDSFDSESEYSSDLSQSSRTSISTNVKRMADSLNYIKCNPKANPRIIDSEVKRFLYETFDVCTSGMELTTEERDRIGPLIQNAIPDIDDCLKDIGDDFDADYGPDALILRSGYQFMVDKFESFPDENGRALKNAFKYFENTGSIVTLDESLAEWKKRPYLYENDIHHTAKELDRPAEVPPSHNWWF